MYDFDGSTINDEELVPRSCHGADIVPGANTQHSTPRGAAPSAASRPWGARISSWARTPDGTRSMCSLGGTRRGSCLWRRRSVTWWAREMVVESGADDVSFHSCKSGDLSECAV